MMLTKYLRHLTDKLRLKKVVYCVGSVEYQISNISSEVNEVCCVGRVEIQIEI